MSMATGADQDPPEAGIPYGTRLHQVAEPRRDEVAIVFVAEDGHERLVTWGEVDDRSTQLARVLAEEGLAAGDYLAISLKNSPEHLFACFAGWKVGAAVVPMRWDLPDWELSRLMDVLKPAVVVGPDRADWLERSLSLSTDPLPEAIAPHGWGMCSSGSTGTPKIILQKEPAVFLPVMAVTSTVVEAFGPLPKPQLVLVPAPLYHANGFTAVRNLMSGDPIVLLERFNAALIVDLIERHRITGFIAATPMLQRLAQLPDIGTRDLSSLTWVQQGAASLPIWLGRFWIDLVGPENFYLSYGSSEGAGLVTCRGDQWLAHPGTLGRGFTDTEVRIIDGEGQTLPTGEIGGIYLRRPDGPAAMYVGDQVSPMETTTDGFVTVGDMGWLDEDGYLFMADRRVDMIVTGGVNVFPAEVEEALSEHPGVADVVVVGLRDPEWGRRVHAIVQASDPNVDADQVIEFARSRLAPYKVPKTVELVDVIPRTEAMKLNRARLTAERDDAAAEESR
ncbi:MAG TPA: AMP-binding protein [Acidimicrobiales bacterium]|nr:AMP-binding protein [Acidimicrobiales bacterium]HVB93611.1 AMP-binding protein [Acidimicrobiales bacterium]